jgi:3-oxoacyl-[acyl-carrier-protein] synthase-3
MGDAAGAFVVGPTTPGAGVLGQVVIDTQLTCGTFYYANEPTDDGARLRLRCSRETQRILRETSADYVRAACHGALEAAGLTVDQVDHFVFNTPTAWFASFACDVIGAPYAKAIDAYARYGNIGPALMPVNLWEAARQRRFACGDLVCIYTIGSVSTASAAVVRWGDVSVWTGR